MPGPKPKNVIGEQYGRLTVIADASHKGSHRRVITRCECGTEKEVFLTVLRSGDAVSCGCYHMELTTTHGQSRNGNPLYQVWSNMKSRCNDPNAEYYADYGGRGITVCPEWNAFEAFQTWAVQAGYTKHLTIDRRNNQQGYYPDNCHWTNRTAQQRNRRSQKGSSSQYIGVSYITRSQKWMAGIKVTGKSLNLGLFNSELEAAIVRDSYIITNQLTSFTMNNVI